MSKFYLKSIHEKAIIPKDLGVIAVFYLKFVVLSNRSTNHSVGSAFI